MVKLKLESIEMEKEESSLSRPVVGDHWWWAAASAAQLGWGVSVARKGYAGEMFNMPFRAAGVGTLFVGAFATAFVATLRVSGIHSVKDAKTLGANIRSAVGLQSQIGDK